MNFSFLSRSIHAPMFVDTNISKALKIPQSRTRTDTSASARQAFFLIWTGKWLNRNIFFFLSVTLSFLVEKCGGFLEFQPKNFKNQTGNPEARQT